MPPNCEVYHSTIFKLSLDGFTGYSIDSFYSMMTVHAKLICIILQVENCKVCHDGNLDCKTCDLGFQEIDGICRGIVSFAINLS